MSTKFETSAFAIDIPVDDEQEYFQLIDAIRASEYTRQEYIEDLTNPRMIAGITGLWAFAESNPFATPEQLSAFVLAYDEALALSISDDELLIRAGSMVTAVYSTRVVDNNTLDGTDRRVADRVLELLKMNLPGLESFGQSQQRMAKFELVSTQRMINQAHVADAITAVLAGVSPTGERVDGLSQAGVTYLESLGYTPMLGQINPIHEAVNTGLLGLPDFAGFVAIRDNVGAHTAIESEVFSQIESIQLEAETTLTQIGQAIVQSGLTVDSIDLFTAASDPDHPDHADAIAFLDARRQSLIESFRETADERVSVFARTLLLSQSSYPDVVYAAEHARSFAGLQLQVNNELAIAQESVGIISSLGGLGAAYASGNLMSGASSLAGVVSGVFSVADSLGDGPASVDEQIFNQITDLRDQVEDLRIQMNERFDIVDAKLDVIFETMITSFGLIQDGIETLIADIASVRSTLDRIEEALFGFAQNLLLVDLTSQTDEVLDYRNKTGFDLAYNNQSPSFVGAASGFTTFSTFTSQTSSFAGVDDNQPLTLTIENASDVLSGDAAVARFINELRRIPSGLVTSEGQPVLGPISSGRTPAPSPWSQAAASYSQLSQESPWYFAYLLQTQQNAGGGNPPQIDQIIDQGQRISSLASATRDRDDLFNALLQRATDDVSILQTLVEASVEEAATELGLSSGGAIVDAWGPIDQIVSPASTPVTFIGGAGSVASTGFTHRGNEIFFSDTRLGESGDFARADLAERLAMMRITRPDLGVGFTSSVQPNGNGEMTTILRANHAQYSFERTLRYRIEYNTGTGWIRYTGFEPFSFYQQRFSEAWTRIDNVINLGNLVGNSYLAGQIRVNNILYMSRLRVLQDRSSTSTGAIDFQADAIETGLDMARTDMRDWLIAEFADPPAAYEMISASMADTRALLDGYLTLGASDAIGSSEALHSALRGLPSAGGLWVDTPEWSAVLAAAEDADSGVLGGPVLSDIPTLAAHFDQRLAALASEIDLALNTPAPSFPYVEFVLADLRGLRDHAFDLAIDDTYLVSGQTSIDSIDGLMSNDIGQEGRIDNDDLMVDLDYFLSPEHTPPANGSLTVFADGSFEYSPNPGYEGIDSFNYRLVAQVGDPDNPVGDPDVLSTPAAVVLRVTAQTCPIDYDNNGTLNFFDVSAFLNAFSTQDPIADLTNDGIFNFFDISSFLTQFSNGCP
ncbi:MAG: GC-type dockerin domain-anchored protein [Phycisphaerales bacterium]|nr:GC-type dockerin domain-anchored protein [Phycisphaerales bacterium]